MDPDLPTMPPQPLPSHPSFALATFAATCAPEVVPASVLHEAKRSFLNTLACALGGAGDPATALLWSALQPFAGAPSASLLGQSGRADALTSALVNGYASNILDFDDTHLATVIHPGPPVLAPLLALAETLPSIGPGSVRVVSGGDLLHAFLLGMELTCRLGVAIGPGHYARGWHITGTCGVIGAAAATGRLLALDPQRMTAALGIAATQAAGLIEMFGGMAKTWNIAAAGRNGLAAALLAARGFTSSVRALEAPRGFGHVLGDGLDVEALTGGLGDRWEAAANTYKPFPCGIVLHPLIDGCIQLARAHALDPAAIDAVEVDVHPLVLRLTGCTDPATGLQAKLSYTHVAAAALVRRAAGVDEFDDDCVNDPAVLRLRARVHPTVVDTLASDQARVRVRLANGLAFERFIEHAIGSLARPMTDTDLDGKFLALAGRCLPDARARTLLAACRGLDSLPDARELVRLAQPAS